MLEGSNILVTGASSGIGRHCAFILGKRKANLYIVGRNVERLEQTRIQAGTNCEIIECDLTKIDAQFEQRIIEIAKTKKFSGFIHCAGMETLAPIRYFEESDFWNTIESNLLSAFKIASLFSRKNILENGSSMVFCSSIAAMVGQPGHSVYAASKGGLISMVKSLSIELAPRKIRVNCVSPGLVQTDMFEKMKERLTSEQIEKIHSEYPLGLGKPEDVAHAICFLISQDSGWITGINLVVDGGHTAQ